MKWISVLSVVINIAARACCGAPNTFLRAPTATATRYYFLTMQKKQGFHWQTVLIAGIGFAIDAYDIFVIGMVLPMVYEVYYPNPVAGLESSFYKNNPGVDGMLKTSTHVGNIVGQLAFGYAADKLGRKQVYGVEMIIVLVATIGSALSCSTVRGMNVLVMLGIWRFIMGMGMGGDYPQSATITAEKASKDYRGMMVAAVFAMQGIGILVGSTVVLGTTAAFKEAILSDPQMLDYVWRICLGITAIPSAAILYFRFKMPESTRFAADQAKKQAVLDAIENQKSEYEKDQMIAQNDALIESQSFGVWIRKPTNALRLFATSYTWFALDVAWYGLSLNQSAILSIIGFGGDSSGHYSSVFDHYYQLSVGLLVIALLGTVPGYWVTVFTIEKLGRKPIQFMGFAVITGVLAILALFYKTLTQDHKMVFLILFTISQFFFNFGPNVTTFVIPSELFPTRFRSTCHGISAASGKVGAILGVLGINPFFREYPTNVLWAYSLIMLSGLFVTMLIPETKGLELEELSE